MKIIEIEVDKALETPVENEAQGQLRRALARLDGGKNWCQGLLRTGDGKVCSLQALGDAVGVNLDGAGSQLKDHPAAAALNRAAMEVGPETGYGLWPVCGVNNKLPGDFAPVQAMFLRAIELAA